MSEYEYSTYVTDLTLFVQRNRKGQRAKRDPVASCLHSRFCLAAGEAILRKLETGTPAVLVDAVNGSPRRRLEPAERSKKEAELDDLRASEEQLRRFADVATGQALADLKAALMRNERQAASLEAELDSDSDAACEVAPFQDVEITQMFAALDALLAGSQNAEAFQDVVTGPRLVRIEPLRLVFELGVLLPTPDGGTVELGPIPFSVETTTRLPAGTRRRAMAELCLVNGWPVSVAAEGVPFECAKLRREKIALELARALRPRIGSKAAGLVAWCEIPEVIAIVSRHLGLGEPDVSVSPELENRILTTYIEGSPEGAKAWPQLSSEDALVPLFRQVHREGTAPSPDRDLRRSPWTTRGWLQMDQETRAVVRQVCRCGSRDLAIVAVPEVEGLMCLECRADRTGLRFPPSWNAALVDAEYWRELGYDTTTPEPPGLREYAVEVEPLSLR